MLVSCFPAKELYRDFITNFRVISCIPIKETKELKLNRYGNFTLSGTNLNSLQLNQEANLVIIEDNKSKYEASYILLSYSGLDFEGKEIRVEPKYELEILSRLMTEDQAKKVNEAYPNFVSLVLNNQQDTIDYKNIANVAQKRLDLYIAKVQADCKAILFYPTAFDNGIISGEDIRELQTHFNTPDELKNALSTNPYHVYVDLVGYSFDKADRLVAKHHPEFIDSKERCEYGCLEILKENELLGDTRLNANIMASEAKKLMPEAKHHMVEAVKDSEVIHYDEETKYASIEETYQDELLIAQNIVNRLHNPIPTTMNWEQYTTVDGFALTDEQSQMLTKIQDNSVVFLTAPAGGGKSSSMKAVIRMLEGNGYSYTMLCPTGTAAKVLAKATGRDAYTIHMFLAKEMMCGDFLILEESSMLGVDLLAKLLKSIPESTKIIFICDPSQLPSISPGNVVHDILGTGLVTNVNLTKIFRYNSSGLITVATDTRQGNSSSFKNNYPDYHFIEAEEDSIAQVVETYGEALKNGYSKNDILVLTPYNKTNKGTYTINEAIQAKYNPNDFTDVSVKHGSTTIRFKIGDRVINKKNNYHVPILEYDEETGRLVETADEFFVANGSIGVIREHYKEDGYDCLAIEFEEGIGLFKGISISNLLLGYAVTIHASQGNQAKAVIVLFDQIHKRMVNRNIEYVSFTRSQQELWVIGNSQVIEEGMEIEETMLRDTNLKDMVMKLNVKVS